MKVSEAMVEKKKHEVPRVPADGGGTKDRSRDKEGEWRKKGDDAGKPRGK